MSNLPVYKIAAIGLGKIGYKHARAMAECSRWELAWVCDLNEDVLAKAVREFAPEARRTTAIDDVLDDDSVDAVAINTLSNVRPELIKKAIAVGKHVICEKPLAPSAAEARALLESIRGTDRLIATNLFNRNAPYVRAAYDFIADGQIGEIALVRVSHITAGLDLPERAADTHRGVEGHVLHDCGMHYVDIMRWFAASEYRDDYHARATQFWGDDYEYQFQAYGRFESGAAFELNNGFCFTTLSKERRNHSFMEFIGTWGAVTLWHDFGKATVKMNGRDRTVDEVVPYGGKKLDIYYLEFARALDTGELGKLPRVEDAVIASEVAQGMVDRALAGEVPNFGSPEDLDRATAEARNE